MCTIYTYIHFKGPISIFFFLWGCEVDDNDDNDTLHLVFFNTSNGDSTDGDTTEVDGRDTGDWFGRVTCVVGIGKDIVLDRWRHR